MAAAIEAVRSGRMRKSQAATFYGVPRTTLLDKLSGRTPEEYYSPLNRRIFKLAISKDDKERDTDAGIPEQDDTAEQVETNVRKILETCAQEMEYTKKRAIKDKIKSEVASDSDDKHS